MWKQHSAHERSILYDGATRNGQASTNIWSNTCLLTTYLTRETDTNATIVGLVRIGTSAAHPSRRRFTQIISI